MLYIITMANILPITLSLRLELYAFALKGEHNVYSLVPNITLCIYIDQKWIYIKL